MISIIVARDKNGVIGKGGKIPWRLPKDMANFKRLTMGHPVIMGRKTFESIGKPLPGRTNIVVTRNPNWKADGCFTAPDFSTAVRLAANCKADEEIFVIGGAEIYKEAITVADTIYLTEVDAAIEGGDTFFPGFLHRMWEIIREDYFDKEGENEYPFKIVEYKSHEYMRHEWGVITTL